MNINGVLVLCGVCMAINTNVEGFCFSFFLPIVSFFLSLGFVPPFRKVNRWKREKKKVYTEGCGIVFRLLLLRFGRGGVGLLCPPPHA